MTIFTGKTEEAAIQAGLTALNSDRDQVTINVVTAPRKGWLGIGQRDAMVDVTLKVVAQTASAATSAVTPAKKTPVFKVQQPATAATPVEAPAQPTVNPAERQARRAAAISAVEDYLGTIVDQLGIDATVTATSAGHRQVQLEFTTDKEGLLIGKHGRTINALQSLAQLFLNHHGAAHVEVELDVAGYRERRRVTLSRLADNTAREVVATGKPIYLDPMPSFERKQIHAVLAKNRFVTTYSAGKEPHRAVVIEPA
ncbi:RNA-binding protein [Levilactobacillus senmaizukei DSM 21775 = NBRC 103853]|uniref:RNA-binding protein KhpB n=1 Tax=Levilactobacillus senmaizukei DSM 21775 = NBRC 103853 TaxID=1423803 RepID=A0A0R2DF92_9LACO|nr:RNA-binding cell elongation regulator Jag/EloR [Levilactobacillus senmaizukei]KRN02696.1 RNA-binding protein [Levilactobacillus senmaizukei DSM 21775 = NBRC 103853]